MILFYWIEYMGSSERGQEFFLLISRYSVRSPLPTGSGKNMPSKPTSYKTFDIPFNFHYNKERQAEEM